MRGLDFLPGHLDPNGLSGSGGAVSPANGSSPGLPLSSDSIAGDAVQAPSGESGAASSAGGSFPVGSLSVPNDIFDKLLNPRKLELLQDPEVAQLLRGSRKTAAGASTSGRRK